MEVHKNLGKQQKNASTVMNNNATEKLYLITPQLE